jgi:hypothetical protein
MFARQPKFAFLLLVAYMFTLPLASSQTSKKKPHKRAVKQEEPAPAPQPPPPPPPPPTLEQMPASAPQVFFRNGQLTIVARNSTLGDILRAVHTQTGASVDVPGNATERVVSNLGPGPARDVLASLLNGSHFNYVMLGSPNDPRMVQRIILTSKSGGTPETAPSNPSEAANQQAFPQQPIPPPEAEEMPVEEVQDESTPEVDQAEQPGQPEEQQVPNGQQQVKTPEQLLQELQRQQQQQQQPGAPQGFPQIQPQPQTQPQPQPQQNPPQ